MIIKTACLKFNAFKKDFFISLRKKTITPNNVIHNGINLIGKFSFNIFDNLTKYILATSIGFSKTRSN